MKLAFLIKEERLRMGITQVALASQAKVSLPALQQLEAGTSNPSIETIERLGRVLGLEVKLQPRSCDWDKLIALGLPLTRHMTNSSASKIQETEDALVQEIRLGLRDLKDERTTEALAGLLLALSEHYPSIYKRAFGKTLQAQTLIAHPTGRVIKLKRLALARISEYL